MKRSILLVLLSSLIFSMVLFSAPVTHVQAGSRPTIKIGALGPLAITPGEDMENGAKLAVGQINAGAGVDVGGTAHDFQLIVKTTSGTDGIPDPVTAGTNAAALIQNDQVVAILGGFRTEVVLGAIQPTINTTHTPFLGVGSTAPIITEYFYRVGPVNGTTLTRNIIGMYGYLAAAKNVTSVAVAREDQAWSAAITAGLQYYLPLLFNITVDATTITPIPVTAGASEIATALNALTTTKVADAIVTLFSAPVGKTFTEQWAATGLNDNYLLAGINVESQRSSFYAETEGAAAGEMELESAPPGVTPTSKSAAFVSAYRAVYNKDPTYTAYASYDAVFILKDTIERADAFTSSAIHAALPATDYLGAATRYKFTSESSAGQVASSSVPADYKKFNNTIAHDLWTTSTVGVPGFPYSQPYFAQWTNTGSKVAVWAGNSTGFASVLSPPYNGVYNPNTGTTTTGSGTQSTTPPPQETTDEGALPGFEFSLVSLVLFASVFITARRRKTNKI